MFKIKINYFKKAKEKSRFLHALFTVKLTNTYVYYDFYDALNAYDNTFLVINI